MRIKPFSLFAVLLGLLLALAAAPADAQGKGKGKGNRNKAQAEQTVYDRYDYDGYGSRRGNGSGKVPPGWCKGKGNPHNTPENCGYGRDRRYDDRYDDRYGDRYDDRYDRRATSRRGSYQREHEEFHYYLDRKYGELASRRPLDLQYQVRLRVDKKAEHDRWHARVGVRH